jgi:hypothetical protein
MAARRLLIVLVVLLGLSTLAAALVPQRTLRDGGTTATTTTQSTTTAPTATPNPAFRRPTKITVGKDATGKKVFPLVRVHANDQFTLLVRSSFPAEIAIPEFGQVAFASPDAPARFELLPDTGGTFGILFAASGKPAGQIEVVAPSAKQNGKGSAKKKGEKPQAKKGSGSSSRAPAESKQA